MFSVKLDREGKRLKDNIALGRFTVCKRVIFLQRSPANDPTGMIMSMSSIEHLSLLSYAQHISLGVISIDLLLNKYA